MLGFHSQNVLQILENMKPIIFLVDLPMEQGEWPVFNSVLGMTGKQAFDLLVRTASTNDAEPVIPIIRGRSTRSGSKIYEVDTIGIVMNQGNYQVPGSISIYLPCIPILRSTTQWQLPVKGQGDGSYRSIQCITITSTGTITLETIE